MNWQKNLLSPLAPTVLKVRFKKYFKNLYVSERDFMFFDLCTAEKFLYMPLSPQSVFNTVVFYL